MLFFPQPRHGVFLLSLVPPHYRWRFLAALAVSCYLAGSCFFWAATEEVAFPGPTVDLDQATVGFAAAPADAERGVFLMVTVSYRPVTRLESTAEGWGDTRAAPPANAPQKITAMGRAKVNAWSSARGAIYRSPMILPHNRDRRALWEELYPEDAVPVVNTGSVKGPSGGLPFALEMVDGLTPGELTSIPVAASGAITPRGTVLPVGFIREKTFAAHRDGATLWLVPLDNLEEAKRAAPRRMEVHGVRNLQEAIDILCARNSDDALCWEPAGNPADPGPGGVLPRKL